MYESLIFSLSSIWLFIIASYLHIYLGLHCVLNYFFLQIEEDAYQEDLGFSLGTMGKGQSGKVRGPPVDSKTKARISKTLQVGIGMP
jgi:hypothetical protein